MNMMQISFGQIVLTKQINKDFYLYFIFNLSTLFKQYNQTTNSEITNPDHLE